MTRIWTGTASVTNGDATVVLTGDPLSDANCPADAALVLDGASYFVLSRTDTTTVELTRNYAGTTNASVSAEIDPMTPAALSVVNASLLAARVQAQLNVLDKNSQGLFYTLLAATGDADPGPGNFAFDDDDPSAATEFYVDNNDGNDRPVTGLLGQWTSGTTLVVRSLSTTAYIAVRMATDNAAQSGYYKGSFSRVGHDGVIAPGEAISIGWFRVGEGLAFDASGTFAERDGFDDQDAGFIYLSNDGDGDTLTGGVLFVKNSATTADWQAGIPLQGTAGFAGWSPTFALANDGARRVLQLTGYVGGEGSAPTADVGKYVSASGYTSTIASAMDIRGATGATGAAGTNGTNGTDGADGADGADGTDPGILLVWNDGNSLADPGSGQISASSDTLASATWLAVSKTNRAGDPISTYLATLDDSTNPTVKGILTLTRSGGNAQATFEVTGITDHTGFVEIAIQTASGATGFLLNDLISFQFSRTGNQGASGAGTGDVNGPGSSVAHRLAAFSDTTGTALEDSGKVVGDFALVANNGSDFSSKQAVFDNLSIDGADIASASTVNLDTATGSYVAITGTTTTTVITLTDGRRRRTLAAAAWPITVGANLVLNNGGNNYTCTAGDIIDWVADGTVIRGTIHPISGAVPKSFLDTDGTLAANSDSKVATQKATKTYVDALIAAANAMVLQSTIDCSANPNYPAADKGAVYVVSVAGKIGGASGLTVEAGDMLLCLADSTASGNQATVGSSWAVIQSNLIAAYVAGGTDVALADGGTGASLTDPNADRIMFWDDSAGQMKWLAPGTGLTITGTTIDAASAGMTDEQRRNQLLMLAGLAKALAGYQRVLNTFADGYKASDGVNSGSSSNYTVDTSGGKVGPTSGSVTLISQATGTNIGDMTASPDGTESLSKAFDGTTAANYANSATTGTGTTTGYVGKNYSSSPKKIGQAKLYGSNNTGLDGTSSASTITAVLRGKNGSAPSSRTDGTSLGSASQADANSIVLTVTSNDLATSWDYVWWDVTTTSNTGVYVAEAEFYLPATPNNMTLVTTSQTADATVDHARCLLEVDPIDSITYGTDLTIEVTCNGGTNWTAAGSYANCGKGQAGRTVIETDDVSCTAGTSFAARVKTLNNKSVNVYKTAIAVH